jgi:kynurenine formamidase
VRGRTYDRPVQERTIRYRTVVDLSHVLHPGIPRWPGDPQLTVAPVADLDVDGWFLRSLTIGEHSGTHMNAPASFLTGGATIDSCEPTSLVVPAVVIDVRAETTRNPDFELARADVERWESAHDRIADGAVVLLYTGWQKRWPDPVAFLGEDSHGGRHFPGFGAATARWLLEARSIVGVGIDTHGVDGGRDEQFATNTAVLERGGIVLENLTNLDRLPAAGTTLVIGILRLAGGSGSPAAVTALVP